MEDWKVFYFVMVIVFFSSFSVQSLNLIIVGVIMTLTPVMILVS